MEMNVSNSDEQLVAKKAGGLNPAFIIPVILAVGILIYLFVLGAPSNFKDAEKLGAGSVAFSDVEGKDIHPGGF
jgi:biopolymer transport protein ExbB